MLKSKVGLEAEFLMRNSKGEVIMPVGVSTDDFPILGEIRGQEGERMAETVANFSMAHLQTVQNLRQGRTIEFTAIERLPLALYKKALSEVKKPKGDVIGQVKNVYGTDMSDYSDQIIKNGKIQGANVSCGLHVHFSCSDVSEDSIRDFEYEAANVPMTIGNGLAMKLELFNRKDYKVLKSCKAEASVLTRPVIEYIVKEMDQRFFGRFAPAKGQRTKYRQPGFFELKPWGFEYRSLPCTPEVIDALPEITTFAFELLDNLNKW